MYSVCMYIYRDGGGGFEKGAGMGKKIAKGRKKEKVTDGCNAMRCKCNVGSSKSRVVE